MVATCFVQPLDLVKTRMQVNKVAEGAKKPSTFSVISNIIKNEGLSTLYTGLSAGLLRQATYTTTRLGIYTWLFETFSTEGVPPGFFMKAALGRFKTKATEPKACRHKAKRPNARKPRPTYRATVSSPKTKVP